MAAYAKSGNADGKYWGGWIVYSKQPYVSDTHGARYVMNYANAQGGAYGKYEKVGKVPTGAKMAKPSFIVANNGQVAVGPLFLMEKMANGFKAESGDWKYTMVMPNGAVFGITNGPNSAAMNFCYECHMAVAEEQDSLMLLPEEYRK